VLRIGCQSWREVDARLCKTKQSGNGCAGTSVRADQSEAKVVERVHRGVSGEFPRGRFCVLKRPTLAYS
jgi:hypothetical protein